MRLTDTPPDMPPDGMRPAGAHASGPRCPPHPASGPLPRLAPLLLPTLLSLSLTACAMQQTTAFDSDAWKSQRGVDAPDNRRNTMVGSLEKVIHTGMARDEVVRLLGEPDIVDETAATEIYELGAARFGIDEEFYEIRYENGKVASHRWGRR